MTTYRILIFALCCYSQFSQTLCAIDFPTLACIILHFSHSFRFLCFFFLHSFIYQYIMKSRLLNEFHWIVSVFHNFFLSLLFFFHFHPRFPVARVFVENVFKLLYNCCYTLAVASMNDCCCCCCCYWCCSHVTCNQQ